MINIYLMARLTISPDWKRVFSNTFYQVIGKVLTASATLVSTIIITRSLGVELYGDFTKAFAFAGLFYMFADFGLNAIYVKNEASGDNKLTFSDFTSLRIALSFALVIVAATIAWMLPYNDATGSGFSREVKFAASIAILTIATQTLLTTANGFFQSRLKFIYATFALGAGSAVSVVLFALTAYFKLPLNYYVASYVVGGAVTVATAYLLVSRFYKVVLRVDFDKWITALKISAPLGISLVLNLVYFRFDTIILSTFRPSADVGFYGLAYKIFEVSLVVPIFFSNAIYPLLIKESQISSKQFLKRAMHGFGILFAAGLVGAVSIFALAPLLVEIVGGSGFAASIEPLRILSLGLPFFYTTAILMWVLVILNKQLWLIPLYSIAALANIVLNLLFIPLYGIKAAAINTVATEGLILLLAVIFIFITLSNASGKENE